MKANASKGLYAGLLGLIASAYFLPSIPASLFGQPWAGGVISAEIYNLYYVIVPLVLAGTSLWLLVARNKRQAAMTVMLMLSLTLVPVLVRSTMLGIQANAFPLGLLRISFLVFFAASLLGLWFAWQAYLAAKTHSR